VLTDALKKSAKDLVSMKKEREKLRIEMEKIEDKFCEIDGKIDIIENNNCDDPIYQISTARTEVIVYPCDCGDDKCDCENIVIEHTECCSEASMSIKGAQDLFEALSQIFTVSKPKKKARKA
jgi:hypothetical protein